MFKNKIILSNLWNVTVLIYLFLSSLCGVYILIAPLIPLCFIFKETIRFMMDYLIKSWVKLSTVIIKNKIKKNNRDHLVIL